VATEAAAAEVAVAIVVVAEEIAVSKYKLPRLLIDTLN